jgi:large subunit ribosomal protein L18
MKVQSQQRELKRIARHKRVRKIVSGTAESPRLCVHRSLKNFYAQVIDDDNRKVIFGMSTLNKEIHGNVKKGGDINAAAVLGEAVAQVGVKKGIKKVNFDRGGYRYHGRVKAFADGARKGGFEF